MRVLPTVEFVRPAWYDRANCRDVGPAMFFAEQGQSSEIARRICAECEVREQCLALAVERGEVFGLWGGCSVRERRVIRSRRPRGNLGRPA